MTAGIHFDTVFTTTMIIRLMCGPVGIGKRFGVVSVFLDIQISVPCGSIAAIVVIGAL